jgi:RNA polymerase sigma-70 factor (ECF subfamily)
VTAVAMQKPVFHELDELTLAHARRGDERASRRLVEAYERAVFALLSRMMVGRERALIEDLAQETFLRVFRALPSFRPDGPARLSTWILTIATRLALDELARRRPSSISIDAAHQVAGPQDTDGVERQHLRRAILTALDALSADQRAVFVLREHHELDYEEIAHALQVDLNTVKSRLFRARTSLRQALFEVRDER